MTAIAPPQPVPAGDGILKLAIMAVGGQGGGVLAGWIETLARGQGYAVQATSVAGVAQRTGATIYYIEMAPGTDRLPVFALAPSAGDVDVVIAAEMMEVGRSILRGFVTPDRTVLIGSTHRALAVSEKIAPGDGIADAGEVRAAADIAARQLILADFEAAATAAGSVISASLFGALARAQALPFAHAAFEQAIRAGGHGVEASLRAFRAGFAAASMAHDASAAPPPAAAADPSPHGPARLVAAWRMVEEHVDALPPSIREMALAGLRKTVAFQDVAYGEEYLARLSRVLAIDDEAHGWELSRQAAKYIANAMAYDDAIRVADEKTRAARLARIQDEMGDPEVLELIDFTHPRAEEVVSLLPVRLGEWIKARPRLIAWIDRRVGKGRRLRTDRLWPFLQLWLVAGLRRWRRASLRHGAEMAHTDRWLDAALAHAAADYALAVEVIKARRLIKGYADTHARGVSKFDRVMRGIELVAGRSDAADWARRLAQAALTDEDGAALDATLRTVRTF
jgi:indolepyruvate ferredoxin oxidoreductase beta subunit